MAGHTLAWWCWRGRWSFQAVGWRRVTLFFHRVCLIALVRVNGNRKRKLPVHFSEAVLVKILTVFFNLCVKLHFSLQCCYFIKPLHSALCLSRAGWGICCSHSSTFLIFFFGLMLWLCFLFARVLRLVLMRFSTAHSSLHVCFFINSKGVMWSLY